MARIGVLGQVVLGAAVVLLAAAPAAPQIQPRPALRFTPRLEPVAETKLLMEGLNQANFRGLERLLKERPANMETWTFARGQALLIAETGNLLLIRPPRNPGETAWMERATELRDTASALARATAARDYEGSRAGLSQVAESCNRCHQAFRVPVRIAPFADGTERKVGAPLPGGVAEGAQLDEGRGRD